MEEEKSIHVQPIVIGLVLGVTVELRKYGGIELIDYIDKQRIKITSIEHWRRLNSLVEKMIERMEDGK